MIDVREILTQISQLTTEIESSYPELFRTLDENPMTLSTSNAPIVNSTELKTYLESLQQLLQHHKAIHKNS